MFKVCLLISLALVGAAVAQPLDIEGPPEPYAYGYETDTHAAAEQKDPSGVVTGYYTLVGDDGRQRRVEYVADAGGFRAKIATNEAGTKSDSPADTELQAAPPTPEQLAQGNVVSQAGVRTIAARSGIVNSGAIAAAPAYSTIATNGWYGNGLWGDNRAHYNGAYNGYYSNGLGYASGYGYGNGWGAGYGNGLYNNGFYNNGLYGNGLYNNGFYNNGLHHNGLYSNGYAFSNYNHHIPASYYRAVGGNVAATRVAAPLAARAPIARSGLGSSNYIVLKK